MHCFLSSAKHHAKNRNPEILSGFWKKQLAYRKVILPCSIQPDVEGPLGEVTHPPLVLGEHGGITQNWPELALQVGQTRTVSKNTSRRELGVINI